VERNIRHGNRALKNLCDIVTFNVPWKADNRINDEAIDRIKNIPGFTKG